jgi:hypothetical protein
MEIHRSENESRRVYLTSLPQTLNRILYILFLFFFLEFQAQETGYLIRNYSPKEYDAFNQVWSCEQDSPGILYFGTSTNIATFDGSKWQKIPLKFGLPIRSLLYANNKLFAGTVGEFGFIDFDKQKKPFYHSLLNLLKPAGRKFSDVWKIYKWKAYIIFQSSECIFLYDGVTIKTVAPERSFALSFMAGDHFYVRQREIGFMELQDDLSLKLIKGGEFYKDVPIVAMCDDPRNNRFVLAGSRDGIIFLDKLSGKTSFLNTEGTKGSLSLNDYYIQAYPLFMSRPDSNTWFLGTRSGLHVLNNDFTIRTVFNKNNGLNDDVVTGACFSRDGNLWLSLNNGISMIEWNSDGYYITEKSGYKGTPEDIIEFKGKNYFATTDCIYRINGNEIKRHVFNFTRLKTELSEYWDLEKVNGRLFSGSSAGLFEIKGEQTEKIHANWTRYLLKVSDTIPLLFSLEKDFLSVVDVRAKPTVIKQLSFKGEELMHGYAEFKNGRYTIWITSAEGLLEKVILNSSLELESRRKYYVKADSVTGSRFINFSNGEISLTQGAEVFYYHPEKDQDSCIGCFVHSKKYHFEDSAAIDFGSNFDGKFYSGASGGQQYFPVKTKSGKYKLVAFNLKQDPVKDLQGYVTDDSLNVWFMGPEFIVLLKNIREQPSRHSFPVILSHVQAGKDPLLTWSGIPAQHSFTYKNNSFVFEYSATYFVEPEQTKYRCRLAGGDDSTWTSWSQLKHKEYMNLHEGNYTFMVQARNIFGEESLITAYNFSVQPPWYRTGLAYTGYALALALFVLLVVRVSNYRLTQSKIKLEKIVNERTRELQEKKKEVTDSIKYALRIQTAILPPDNYFKRLLPDSFIFYRPKDIVSGDFYWVEAIRNKVLFAAVDCTGHGVPGAMMSVIGLKLMNSAVLDRRLDVPTDILNYVDKGVHETLRQGDAGSGVKDGMDLAVCAWDRSSNILEFAGVFNSLWLVRKNIARTWKVKSRKEVLFGNDLLEFKPDKMPIGNNVNGNGDNYTNHYIKLEKGDIIYIYTDGYADQFGGAHGKKFKYNKLKEMLVANAHLPLPEQQKILGGVFDEWKNANEQVDDVLVMGIKVG